MSIDNYGDAVIWTIGGVGVGIGLGAGLRREGAELKLAGNGAALQAEG